MPFFRYNDSLIGVANVTLSPLLACRSHYRCQTSNKTYPTINQLRSAQELAAKVRNVRRQRERGMSTIPVKADGCAVVVTRSCDGYVPIIHSEQNDRKRGGSSRYANDTSVEGGKKRVGATRIVLSLEDLGPLEPAMPDLDAEPPAVATHTSAAPPSSSVAGNQSEQQQHSQMAVEAVGNVTDGENDDVSGNRNVNAEEASCVVVPTQSAVGPGDGEQEGEGSIPQAQEHNIPEPLRPSHAAALADPRKLEEMIEREVDRRLGTREAKAMQELEVWRRTEEAAWFVQLANKERQVLERVNVKALAAEGARAEQAKEAEKKYNRLEKSLANMVMEIETHRRKLRMKQDQLANTTVSKREELQLLEKQIKEKLEHERLLMKYKLDSLEKQLRFAKKESDESKTNLLQTEEDFAKYRALQRETPESMLRAQVAKLQIENSELHSRLQREEMSGEAQKTENSQLQETIQKLARVLREERDSRTRKELNQLRLDYVAREERYVLDCDRQQLGDIKKELDNLRFWGLAANAQKGTPDGIFSPDMVTSQGPPHQSSPPPPPREHAAADPSNPAGSVQKPAAMMQQQRHQTELGRLVAEKAELLESGSYDCDHYMIRELDRLIHLQQQH
jgi:hypothetical protein